MGLGTRAQDPTRLCHFCKYCLTAGRKPSFFSELVIVVSCAAQITDREPQYMYCLVCPSSTAILVSQVLFIEITGTDCSASPGFWLL